MCSPLNTYEKPNGWKCYCTSQSSTATGRHSSIRSQDKLLTLCHVQRHYNNEIPFWGLCHQKTINLEQNTLLAVAKMGYNDLLSGRYTFRGILVWGQQLCERSGRTIMYKVWAEKWFKSCVVSIMSSYLLLTCRKVPFTFLDLHKDRCFAVLAYYHPVKSSSGMLKVLLTQTEKEIWYT